MDGHLIKISFHAIAVKVRGVLFQDSHYIIIHDDAYFQGHSHVTDGFHSQMVSKGISVFML